jgi:hypothetical protein
MRRSIIIFGIAALILFGFGLRPSQSHAASLLLSPSSNNLTVGGTKTITISVNSGGVAINASQATLSFPADKLQVVSLSKANLFKYWTVEPSYSNSNGTITFGGGLPTPGYSGGSKAALNVTFRAKAIGTARVSFTSGLILANDGEGTNVLSSYGSSTFSISAAPSANTNTAPVPEPEPQEPSRPTPNISSTSHPDQNVWYAKSDVVLNWSKPAGMIGASIAFDHSATTQPDEVLDDNTSRRTFTSTADGAWYFHVRAKYANGWSSTAHYRVQIDTTAPENFVPQVTREGGNSNPNAAILFEAKDVSSGIESYAFTLDDQKSTTVTSPIKLDRQRAGLHQFTVRAFDRAGNSRDAIGQFLIEGSPAPRLNSVPKSVILFGEISVEGLAVDGDTVVLYIDEKEVGRFLSNDTQIQPVGGVAVPDGLILWQYKIRPLLVPGRHQLTAIAINRYGVESATSVPSVFTTLGSTIQVFGLTLPLAWLIVLLVAIIILLVVLLIVVFERYRHWRRQQDFDLEEAEEEINEEIEKLQNSLDQDVSGALRVALTGRSIQATAHEKVKRDIIQTRERIDAFLEQAEVKKSKRKTKKRRA